MSISIPHLPQENPSAGLLVPPPAGLLVRWTLESVAAKQSASNTLTAPGPMPGAAGSAPTILLFGRDPILLKTRQWILTRHGYRCRTATEIAEVERSFSESPIRLLILCYSLPGPECDRALQLAHSRPATQSLVLVYGVTNCALDQPSIVLNVLDGPAALVSLVDKLLKSPPQSHDS